MGKLTTKDRWEYKENKHTSKYQVHNVIKRDKWINFSKTFLPVEELDFIELGCAPGLFSAAISMNTKWKCHGIDYSEDSDMYIDTMNYVGKKATLYKEDLFRSDLEKKFDIVGSFGLVEHFRGGDLEKVFDIHDKYLKKGGYLIIEMPNFTGFHYLWHYIFDKPDLDNHNIDTMQPKVLNLFKDKGYKILFNDYHGILRLWGNTSCGRSWLCGKIVAAMARFISLIAKLLSKIGLKLSGQTFSPYLLFIAKKK